MFVPAVTLLWPLVWFQILDRSWLEFSESLARPCPNSGPIDRHGDLGARKVHRPVQRSAASNQSPFCRWFQVWISLQVWIRFLVLVSFQVAFQMQLQVEMQLVSGLRFGLDR